MAKDPKPVVSETMRRFVAANVQPDAPSASPPEKADVSYTIYVSKSEAERIAEIQRRAGNQTRQAVLRMLVQSGLEQFAEATGWWKGSKEGKS